MPVGSGPGRKSLAPHCQFLCRLPSTIITKRWECREGASADEIRKAYRKLARKYHPDLNPGRQSGRGALQERQEAYDILSDPKKRQMYDQFGFYSENGFPGGGPGRRARPGPQPEHGFRRLRFLRLFRRARAAAPGGGGARTETAAAAASATSSRSSSAAASERASSRARKRAATSNMR